MGRSQYPRWVWNQILQKSVPNPDWIMDPERRPGWIPEVKWFEMQTAKYAQWLPGGPGGQTFLDRKELYVNHPELRTFSERQILEYMARDIHYSPQLPDQHFKRADTAAHPLDYIRRPLSVFDIETNDAGEPISISAAKFLLNKTTGKLELEDTFQRFYRQSWGTLSTQNVMVHGLTPKALGRLRHQQIRATGQSYSRRYNPKEVKALQEFFGNSILVGHNIVDFDIPKLFPKYNKFGKDTNLELPKNQVIDTLIAARNLFPDEDGRRVDRNLDAIFQRFTGKTMASAGLPHHDAMSDTLATAKILNGMLRLNENSGEDPIGLGKTLRTILTHSGTSLGYRDAMLNGPQMIIKGGVREIKIDGPEGVQYLMSQEELTAADAALQNKLGRKLDEYHLESIVSDADILHPEGGFGASSEMIEKLQRTMDSLTHTIGLVRDAGTDIVGFGSALSHYGRANQIRLLASTGYMDMADMAESLGIPSTEQERSIRAARDIQRNRSLKSQFNELVSLYRQGYAGEGFTEMFKDNIARNWSSWGGDQTDALNRAQHLSNLKTMSRIEHARAAGRISPEQEAQLYGASSASDADLMLTKAQRSFSQQAQLEDAILKDKVFPSQAENLRRDLLIDPDVFDKKFHKAMIYKANITKAKREAERDQLDAERSEHKRQHTIDRAVARGQISDSQAATLRAIKSNEGLADSLEDIIAKNKELQDVYHSIASIKFYNFDRWKQSATAQAKGVIGSAKGVLPGFVLDAADSVTNAWSASYESATAPWKAGINAGLNILGPIIGGFAGGPVGVAVGMGAAGATSQIVGNVGEALINKKGYDLQNNMSTLQAIIGWVSTPFKLLGKATKLLAGSFLSLAHQFKLGLGDMPNMGNPLTSLTNSNMGQFQGSELLDVTAMLSKGSTQSAIEGFAQEQVNLRLGKINTQRMVAASMLGVQDLAYSLDPNADKTEQYYDMVNRILNNTGMSDHEKLGYAGMIDNTLPRLLQTAMTLGVTDIRGLANGSVLGMYWNPLNDTERASFQESQAQMGMAQMSFTNSRMRFSNRIWNDFGKDIYSGISKSLDLAANGQYGDAFVSLKDMASDLWNKVKDVWDNAGGFEGIKTSAKKFFEENIWNPIKEAMEPVKKGFGDVVREVFGVVVSQWDLLMKHVLDKITLGLSFLSTVKIDWKKLLTGEDPISYIGKESVSEDKLLPPQFQKWYKRVDNNDAIGSNHLEAIGIKPSDVGDLYKLLDVAGGSMVYQLPTGGTIDIKSRRDLDHFVNAVEYYGSGKGYSKDQIVSWLKLEDSNIINDAAVDRATREAQSGGNTVATAINDFLESFIGFSDYVSNASNTVTITPEPVKIEVTVTDPTGKEVGYKTFDKDLFRSFEIVPSPDLTHTVMQAGKNHR